MVCVRREDDPVESIDRDSRSAWEYLWDNHPRGSHTHNIPPTICAATSQASQPLAMASQYAEGTESSAQKTKSDGKNEAQTHTEKTAVKDTTSFTLGLESRENVKCVVSLFSTLALYLGAIYCTVLGYNYRYITLQVAKLECALQLDTYVLKDWPRRPEHFIEKTEKKDRKKFRYRLKPPEVIAVFYWACLTGMLAVMFAMAVLVKCSWGWKIAGALVDAVLLALGWYWPYCYGGKFVKLCEAEPRWPNWTSPNAATSDPEGSGLP